MFGISDIFMFGVTKELLSYFPKCYDQKEFEDISYRFEKFEECGEILEVNENYKLLLTKSPENLSYEH